MRRCADRVLDADEIRLNGREHPTAFILMLAIPALPDFWLCMEAHTEARFSDLDRFIRRAWFPHSEVPGGFVSHKSKKRASEKPGSAPLEMHARMGNSLAVKDKLTYRVRHGRSAVEVQVDVVGLLRTAIMHRPIDVVAFTPNRGNPPRPGPGWETVPFLT